MSSEEIASYPTENLARTCAQQASRRRTPTREQDACYELFRRAFASPPDDDAWQAILNQYRRLVHHWLGQYAGEDTCQEVFLRLWKARQGDASFASRFPNTSAVIGFLKQCAIVVRIEAWREEERRRKLSERLHDNALIESILARTHPRREYADLDFKEATHRKLKDEREQVVFASRFYYNLSPREIQAERPDLFPRVRDVYRVKENLLKRLQRDPELSAWWASYRRNVEDDGGNPVG